MSDQVPEVPVVSIPTPPEPPKPAQTFTAEDIAKARQEEKDKLYPRIEDLQAKTKDFENFKQQFEREAAEKAEAAAAAARAEAEAEAKKRFEESDAKTLIEQTSKEWEQKFQQLQNEREQERLLFQKEQQFQQLKDYARDKVNTALQNQEVAPELADYVSGNNEAEIDASLEFAKQKTQQILEGIRQAQVQARSQQTGVQPTGYAPVGPMDTDPGQKQYTLEQLKAMPMSEFAKHRGSLLGAAASASQSNRGLYG